MKLTALELYVIIDTLRQSLKVANYSGRGTVEGRQRVLELICDIMHNMNVEVSVSETEGTEND